MKGLTRRRFAAIAGVVVLATLTAGATGCGSGEPEARGDSPEASQTGASDGGDSTQGLVPVNVGVMTGNLDQSLVAIGRERGTFEGHGLDVRVSEYAAGINTVDAIVTGQNDIGLLADYAAVNRLGNTSDSTDLRLFVNYQRSHITKLYVNPDRVKTVGDLAGQGFVTLPGTVWDYWVGKTYEYAGISEADRDVINVDSAQDALGVLTRGDGVAFWASGANASKLEEAGFEPILTMDDLGIFVDSYFVSTSAYLDANPQVAQRFLEALREIEEWVEGNLDEAGRVVEGQTTQPADQFVENVKQFTLSTSLGQDAIDHLNDIKDWARDAGKFENDFEVTDFIDTKPLEDAGLAGSDALNYSE
ncbi:MAG: ABC transporter substrate-binding protein [Coriobacteriales bacterium]|jgi:ABC-type nitrate/sulfonate/bicarbonate transport system substrate-binding protein